MNKKYLMIILMLLCTFSLFAGDVANYVNLGFSDDSQYFMFGLYGIDSSTTKPYAELHTVAVKANRYAENGLMEKEYSVSTQPGQDGSGALFNLMKESADAVEKFSINHLNKGRIVYLLINGNEPKDKLEFRDFTKNSKYQVALIQQRFGTEKEPSASFYINLSVTDKNTNTKTYTIGLPNYKRKDVMKYRIKQVMFAPDEKSLVFVVEKEVLDGNGPSIRYMVETVVLD